MNRNIEEKFAVLRSGQGHNGTRAHYNTLDQAVEDGAVVMAYGYIFFQFWP